MADPVPAAVRAAILAGAKAYAADTYKGARALDGTAQTWDLLTDTDKAACVHKAQVVLTAALAVLADHEEAAGE